MHVFGELLPQIAGDPSLSHHACSKLPNPDTAEGGRQNFYCQFLSSANHPASLGADNLKGYDENLPGGEPKELWLLGPSTRTP